jgi:nucleotide-binding universal stress UspA family protein
MQTAPAPFTDILVPLDFSEAAERALRPALELANRTGVPLRLMQRVVPAEKDSAAAYLADVADRYTDVIDIETMVVERGSVPDAILQGVDLDTLVCMSSHGRGRVAGALIGSVAEALLRTNDQPVLVVGPHVPDTFTFTGRVAACIDGSKEAERTLAPSRSWAATLGLPFWLVEVVPDTPPEWTTEDRAAESADLGRLASRFDGVAGWDTYHSRHPARELAERSASTTEPTALLVMATHGRTGWDRLRLGSVTAATVHAASTPVLVVPAGPEPLDPGAGRREETIRS